MKRSECSCKTCQSYCQHVPGWFLPNEVAEAAKLKRLTLRAFFKRYLTVDYWTGDTVFVLRPAVTTDLPGDIAPFRPFGTCVFFKNGLCSIHAKKPHECATSSHARKVPKDWHERTADAWRTPKAQAMVRQLLGREPEEPHGSFWELMW